MNMSRFELIEKPIGWAALFVMLMLVFFTLYGENGYFDLRRIRFQEQAIIQENQQIEWENRALERKIARLKSDLSYIEHIARHELGMLAEHELVFRCQNGGNNSQN